MVAEERGGHDAGDDKDETTLVDSEAVGSKG